MKYLTKSVRYFDAYSYSDNIYPYIIHSLKEVRKFLHSFVLVLLSVLLSPLKSLLKGSNSLLSLWASWAWDYFLKKFCLKLFFSSFLCIVCKYVGKVPISKKRNVRLHLFLLYCTTTINVVAKALDWSLGRIYNCDSSQIRQFQLNENCLLLVFYAIANRKE